jgi:hypothetical protein
VCQVLNAGNVDPLEGIAPEKICSLKYVSVTSFYAERSFSAYKQIPLDER